MSLPSSGLLRGHDGYRVVHVGALALCAIMLPWSTAILSMAQMLLVANWLVEGVVRKNTVLRFRQAFATGPSLVFISFFLLHVVGLAWTQDLEWGGDLVRILLPVLSFGAVLAASPRLQRQEYLLVLRLGAWSVVASTFICLFLSKGDGSDYRSLSVFISHIRLSLLLCLAVVFFLLDKQAIPPLRYAGYLMAGWALFFIDRLGSIQGYCILIVVAAVFVWRWAGRRTWPVRHVVRGLLIAVPVMAGMAGWAEMRERYRLPDPTIILRFERSAGGEHYQHDFNNPQMENGNHVWMYVAMGELHRGWPARSQRLLGDTDDRGHPIWSTLVRYMASKGLRKDSVGLAALTDADIEAVERGEPNAYPDRWGGLSARFDEVVFELQQYHALGAADGHSVAMRLEYLRTGYVIAKENWLFGVGTGDTERAFQQTYERMGSVLSPRWRLRAHNEYLTLWITFGIIGFCWSLFSWWWPAYRMGAWRAPLFISWAVIFGISCLTDDTIETQAGATFFALYYALFVFAAPKVSAQEDPVTGPPRAAD